MSGVAAILRINFGARNIRGSLPRQESRIDGSSYQFFGGEVVRARTFWEKYWDSFEPRGRDDEGPSAALALTFLLPTLALWLLWHSVAWIFRIARRPRGSHRA